jgi:hypothetical protein
MCPKMLFDFRKISPMFQFIHRKFIKKIEEILNTMIHNSVEKDASIDVINIPEIKKYFLGRTQHENVSYTFDISVC